MGSTGLPDQGQSVCNTHCKTFLIATKHLLVETFWETSLDTWVKDMFARLVGPSVPNACSMSEGDEEWTATRRTTKPKYSTQAKGGRGTTSRATSWTSTHHGATTSKRSTTSWAQNQTIPRLVGPHSRNVALRALTQWV